MTKSGAPANWRSFGAWSAVGAVCYILAVWIVTAALQQDILDAMLRPTKATALLAGLIVSMAAAAFTRRTLPISVRTVRNFLIQHAVAIGAFLLVIRVFSGLAATEAVGRSEWVAAVTGSTLVAIACLGVVALAGAHTRAGLIDDEDAAEEMRDRGRLFFYSWLWTAACGLLLVVLALAGSGLLSPTVALAGAVVLIPALVVLGLAAWRLSDELGRTLSRESGNMAFYLIAGIGGGWAMLAHLGFVDGPAPLDWLTMFTVLMFVASFIAVGRRRLLTR